MLRIISSEDVVLGEFDVLDEPSDMYLGDRNNSLDDFFKLFEASMTLSPEPYSKISSFLGLNPSDALKIVPIDRLKTQRNTAVKQTQKILSVDSNVQYLESFIRIRNFLDSLEVAIVDDKSLTDLIERQVHDGVKSNLKTFHDPKKIKYSMSSSSTGRLSVIEGPRVLTSPVEVKGVLKSRHANGKILQIDLSCAEPNFALFALGEETMPDLYEFCAKEVLDDKVDRSTAKLVLLSAIYGQSVKNLSQNLPEGVNANNVIKRVKEFLGINNLLERLRKSWSAGDLRNFLGRPLKSNQQRLLISHYLQSSVAEAAILMFENFCESNDVLPLFVIHDALIIDCKDSVALELTNQVDFRLKFKNKTFPASITVVG